MAVCPPTTSFPDLTGGATDRATTPKDSDFVNWIRAKCRNGRLPGALSTLTRIPSAEVLQTCQLRITNARHGVLPVEPVESPCYRIYIWLQSRLVAPFSKECD